MTPRAFVAIAVIWFLFALAVLAGFVLGMPAIVVALLFSSERVGNWVERNFKAADKAAAAFLGWHGKRSVSAECGHQLIIESMGGERRACRLCRLLCPVLAWALSDPRHCQREASRDQ